MSARAVFRSVILVLGLLLPGLVTAQTDAVLKVVDPAQPNEAPVLLTMAALEAIETQSFHTSTIWTDGVHEFRGVSLTALLDHLDLSAEALIATAINDYAIPLPMPAADEAGPILAYEMDGAPMTRRGKGPLWLVYPYDSHSKFRTQTIYARSVWQLNKIEIVH